MDTTRAALLAAGAFAAGAINSVAGGGSVVSFPVAVAMGLPPIVANATNTVALTPAALASAWAYRREVQEGKDELRLLLGPAALGGALGALLLLITPERAFDTSIPFLLLLATMLLFWQNLRTRKKRTGTGTGTGTDADTDAGTDADADAGAATDTNWHRWRAALLMLLAAVYGGFFGAGMGIITLALLGWLGSTDMHRMNGTKTLIGTAVNGAAALGLILAGAVDPMATVFMTIGGTAGGFLGAALARKVDQSKVRWLVVAIGLALTVLMAWQRWR